MNTPNPQYYWPEDQLYFVYKLINAGRFAGKKLLDFEYLRAPTASGASVWLNFHKMPPLKINGLVFHKNVYERYDPTNYAKLEKRIEAAEKYENEIIKNRTAALKRVFNNNFEYKDLLDMPLVHVSMFDWFEFDAVLPKETLNKLQNYLDVYIKNYIDENLLITDKNIQRFSKQRGWFSSRLNELSAQYGNHLMFFENSIDPFGGAGELLFVHNIVALEYLGLITVEEFAILDYDKDISKQKEEYRTKIEVLPKLKSEYVAKEKEPSKDTTNISKMSSKKLAFYPDDGVVEYKSNSYELSVGSKGYELINFFNSSKNTPLELRFIQDRCNTKIRIEKHKFKTEKDISDTINYIRKVLKVKKGEYFPLYKKGNRFIWEEK